MYFNTFFAVYTVIYLEQFYTHVYPLDSDTLEKYTYFVARFWKFFFS